MLNTHKHTDEELLEIGRIAAKWLPLYLDWELEKKSIRELRELMDKRKPMDDAFLKFECLVFKVER